MVSSDVDSGSHVVADRSFQADTPFLIFPKLQARHLPRRQLIIGFFCLSDFWLVSDCIAGCCSFCISHHASSLGQRSPASLHKPSWLPAASTLFFLCGKGILLW